MPAEIIHLHQNVIREINKLVITQFGGERGLVNESSVEFIAERVKTLHEKLEFREKIVGKAAFYLFQIVRERHPFTDGNKRTGIIATEFFLFMNGHSLKYAQKEREKFLLELASKKKSSKQTAEWVRNGITEELAMPANLDAYRQKKV